LKKKITIVGGGSCALILACELNPQKFDVTIYERNAAPGRKFLVAGDGGLNLTHSENESDFIKRYTPYFFFEKAFTHFSNKDLIHWLNANGVETFVGSSGRVFPKKEMKPVDVLNVFLKKIKSNSFIILTKQVWKGFSNDNNLIFENISGHSEVKSDYVIFCIGGASWPVTGSKGDWTNYFAEKKITIDPFQPSNCAFRINWDENFISKNQGKVLKNVAITCNNQTHSGEVVLTKFGIEGSGIYPLSPQIRYQLNEKQKAEISIDLKPLISLEKIKQKVVSIAAKKNFTENLKQQLNLNQLQIQLLKTLLPKDVFLSAEKLSCNIKNLKISINGIAPIEEAISTVGGISLTEIDADFQLKKLPRHYAIGEMLNYDAPTGGYLLQSCFSMAKFLAHYLNKT